MTPLFERLLMIAVAAVAWPLWWPLLTRVLAEIRRAAADDGDTPPHAPEPSLGRHRRFVNSAWDDMHLGRKGRTHVARRDGEGFVHRG